MRNIFGHWKTTVQSLLTGIMGLSTISIPTGMISVRGAKWLFISTTAAKILLGCFQKDAGKQDAQLPDGQTATVDAHEVPDSPAAEPVTT